MLQSNQSLQYDSDQRFPTFSARRPQSLTQEGQIKLRQNYSDMFWYALFDHCSLKLKRLSLNLTLTILPSKSGEIYLSELGHVFRLCEAELRDITVTNKN